MDSCFTPPEGVKSMTRGAGAGFTPKRPTSADQYVPSGMMIWDPSGATPLVPPGI